MIYAPLVCVYNYNVYADESSLWEDNYVVLIQVSLWQGRKFYNPTDEVIYYFMSHTESNLQNACKILQIITQNKASVLLPLDF